MITENTLPTPIIDVGSFCNNHLWIKREDLLPFSFGGNKARKAQLFFSEIEKGEYDCVVTYGSGSSNHCRIIANECCRRGLDCYIISPEETACQTYNSRMTDLFGAERTIVPVSEVHDTINNKLDYLKKIGKRPFHIEGGGHGNIGTEAYVQCYQEIVEYEQKAGVHFDYIFFASGTGTTQAGLVCGQLINHDGRKIVGISIARKNPKGRNVILDSIRSYFGNDVDEELIQSSTIFIDDYTEGYGNDDVRINDTIATVLKNYGIPLDPIYTGKAFMGMTEYINDIKEQNILFIHTGGTPLFFDYLLKVGKQFY